MVVGAAMLALGVIYSGQIRSFVIAAKPSASTSPASAPAQAKYYTCGMHPWVILDHPGNCPICHMELVPLDPAKFTGQVALDPVISQEIGVRLADVTSGPVTRVIRTVGNVDYDETAVRDVTTKVSGWIEKLHVDSTGQPVKKGQPLFELFSPELYTAQTDYLLAMKESSERRSLQDVRMRLKFFDISDEQIEALAKSGKAAKTMTIVSPFDGLVITKNAVEGMKFEPGAQLYRIADLSKVWVLATLYEYQLPYVQVGQKAAMSLPYMPNQKFDGQVAYIYPYLNAELRQAKVRLEFANPGLLLKPGMFADVELHSTLARDRVLAPREAIIDTGTRQVAMVSAGQGRFEPRDVRVGVEAQDGMVEILSGLKPGEKVVTSAQFLLDSESNVREALAKMVKGTPVSEQGTAAARTQPAPEAAVPETAMVELAAILKDYLAMGNLLASDTIDGLAKPGKELADHVDALLKTPMPDEHFWHKHQEAATIRGKALEISQAKDIAQARENFADLGVALSALLKATGVPAQAGAEIDELHCPMYRSGQGGSIWLQPAGGVRNPFYGKTMLECFDKQFALPQAKAKGEERRAKSETTKNR
jgi:multidrug efflux pump subunit AcrA (membrane-fusion protein)